MAKKFSVLVPGYGAQGQDTRFVKAKDNYVPTFINSSPSYQQQPSPTTAQPTPGSPGPIFYFRDVVEDVTAKQEVPPEAPSNPPEETPTPSPVYYKPAPEPPAPEQPQQRYPEAPPREPASPEPTASPVYYKYSDEPKPEPPVQPETSAPEYEQEPKSGESGSGFPSQDFVNEANFQIPDIFRSFLNTPPKWINMKNW